MVACQHVQNAVARHLRDLQRQDTDGFPYIFDQKRGEHVIRFIQTFCKHFEGEKAGEPLELEPWQQFIIASVFGWVHARTGHRRFNEVYEQVARKNGKSTKLAAIGLALLAADKEAGAQVYTAATKRDQARIIHRAAVQMYEKSHDLKQLITKHRDNLFVSRTAAFFKPLGEDSNTEDGLNVHGALVDEYHAHKSAGMVEVLRSGMGSRTQPLLWIITTAGLDISVPCYDEMEYAAGVLDGTNTNENYFAIIYTLDEEDDWKDESVWIKANPNLGVSVNEDDMRKMFQKAIEMPSKQTEFLTKKLDVWTQQETVWLSIDVWRRNETEVDVSALQDRVCLGGIDIASRVDLAACALCFPPESEGEPFQFVHHAWMPQDTLVQHIDSDRVPYDVWVEQGLLSTTPGEIIDLEFIKQYILDAAERYQLKEVCYDPWGAQQFAQDLTELGVEMYEFRQGSQSMSPAVKEFESKAFAGEMAHGDNPLIRWQMGCVNLWQGPTGLVRLVKPDRTKSRKRIDNIVAAVMALDRAVRYNGTESVYEERGLLIL
jgi:phage terminase large subunit-like protein